MPGKAKTKTEKIHITPIEMQDLVIYIEGTSPLGVSRFSYKAQTAIEEKQAAGSTAKTKKTQDPRDFEADYINSQYRSEEGWLGVNAACFRNGMISMCRVSGFVMKLAKLAVFVDADGKDERDGTPLVRVYGEQEMWKAPARNSGGGGYDIRVRTRWKEWKMRVRCHYDAGVFDATDVVNLMHRLGVQGGICEGRHDSREGPGIGMGCFHLIDNFLEPPVEEKRAA